MTGRRYLKVLILVTLGVLLFGAIGLTACSNQATPTPPVTTAPTSGGGNTATVSLSGNALSPATLTIAVGTTVTWKNQDFVQHTVTSNDKLFDKILPAGASFSYTFNQAGSFGYHCSVHSFMIGTIIVQ